ncbi:MAG: DUF452 family protein [Victivallaceae bacterium]|jgi:biotin synthesis protein BioG|nr:DUF452 family protein [Victivallaceae bacterium]NLK83424.1 DUF452 family protein [Lentisphaerota bacterium]MDD3117458.1 DUF452 family protein [Victivallaceae bacterium]MDD3703804.1 DUF452 family protein [Victivallaceae bacterium]MDD4318515.1 DUF452 family protein [Victivallaceae bacterium]
MKRQWINRKANPVLLLFFNGWGMDANVLSHLDPAGNDVLMFYDYTEPELPALDDISDYPEIHLAAWSFGVYAAASSGLKLPLLSATAFNGTLFPINADEGIDPALFTATLENWNEAGQKKFYRRISGKAAFCSPLRTTEEQRLELAALGQRANAAAAPEFRFTRAFAAENDRIFPLAAQRYCWEKREIPLTVLPGTHYLFDRYQFWKELYQYENKTR